VFTAEEFLELCFTHLLFAMQVQEAILALQKRSIPPTPSSQSSVPAGDSTDDDG
jgi:hypothetical protein